MPNEEKCQESVWLKFRYCLEYHNSPLVSLALVFSRFLTAHQHH